MLLAAVVATVDQGTKYLAERSLTVGERVDVLGQVLGLRLFYNSGAAFSLGTGVTPVLSAFAVVAVVAMVVALLRTGSRAWALSIGVLMGGAVGNLTDRLLRPPGPFRGEVVDFLELPRWPIFNVADMAVIAGAVLIALLSLREVPFREPDAVAAADAGPDAAPAVGPAAGPDAGPDSSDAEARPDRNQGSGS